MSIDFDLSGTTAVVTGAKRGIGFAMAAGLAAAGADIIGVSATIEPTGSAIAAAARSTSPTGRRSWPSATSYDSGTWTSSSTTRAR